MRTGTATATTCPAWCNGAKHTYDRGPRTHPDDAGCFHVSDDVDSWTPDECGEDADAVIRVYVQGYRHDNESGVDWPDAICADNAHPGFLSSVQLQVPDARRLGQALLAACALSESANA